MFTDPRANTQTAAAATARKFMFDQSFEGSAAKPAERKPVTLRPEQVDALKQESYDAGFVAGQIAGEAAQTQKLAALMSAIEQRIAALHEHMQRTQDRQNEQTRDIALAVARKLLPDFTARNGLQEIGALLTAAIAEMAHEPRLVVRVNDADFDAVNARIHEITAQKAYAGKVVVLADAALAAGDCRIEWADGGIERNTAATWSAVERIITPEQPR